jgi:hypothetical protein
MAIEDLDTFVQGFLKRRAELQTGIHCTLRNGFNRFSYVFGFIIIFSIMYHFINKLVYRLTDNQYIKHLCIQKYELKNKGNKSKESAEWRKEVEYNLWFYRFSWMECISCLILWPILVYIFRNFDSFHTELYTYVDWSVYLVPLMMIGHYMIDIGEVVKAGYVKRSRDLLLHHIVVSGCFIYHLCSLENYPWITTLYFMEFNSFFNRFNLILKFHDAKKSGIPFNISNIMNFLTMIFVRFYCILLMFVYFYENMEYALPFYTYTIVILMCLFAMTYLAWQSFKYMLNNDLVYVKMFLLGSKKKRI